MVTRHENQYTNRRPLARYCRPDLYFPLKYCKVKNEISVLILQKNVKIFEKLDQ